MGEDMFYTMNKSKLWIAVIVNNLDHEQTPTRRDVEVMGKVLKDIGKFASSRSSTGVLPNCLDTWFNQNMSDLMPFCRF